MGVVKAITILGLFAASGCGLLFGRRDLAVACGKQHPVEVVSWTFFPDPIPEARRIDQWRVVIRSDSSETCRTNIQIVEKDSGKAAVAPYTVYLSVGTNEILMNALATYRLSGTNEVCFQLNAEADGSKSVMPGPERACAKAIDKGLWSLR